ncbi:right-handed parallel beta-helix repeat-containing protein [Paenibacillus radicis (ex Xue et al. 2023)]|uniref:Right-handed parallel beta-helix repeat-containing protein n=1 Tax=Paenibacillus radicis (ex Xue et al. 2023) TaxID=2972489 RepID=A0ABT1YNS0_9BACL|nr:right-handed parallel beta-helix repeat-containing protein [Paenibacillus radicis (ex Xue et al. 2023)]MCR8633645.1 right-handed parallel beta-helix repeat-containing protein [Paenibacillus radicis (ex Xue et al. 2023)]
MLPIEPNDKEQETGKPMTRRQMLASLGAAGVLLAAGAGFPGEARAATTIPVIDTSFYYNVKDYGAQGNGRYGQDDAPYIQAAINAASADKGGTVYLPPGDYVIKSSLFMRSKVHLLGAGAGVTIIRSIDTNLHMIKSGSDSKHFSIDSLTFEGSGIVSTSLSSIFECGIYIFDSEHVRINRCLFNRVTKGIHVERSQHVNVTNCIFTLIVGTENPNEGYGIVVEGGSNNILQTNKFKNVNKNAIYVTAGSSYSIIADNVIEGCKDAAILVTSKLKACSYHLIQGNLISGANLGDQEFSCTFGIRLKDYCTYNTVVNNIISRSASGGIQLDAADNGGDDRPFGNTVTSNTINTTPLGISVFNGDANTVKSNEVRWTETGILLDTVGVGSASSAKQNIVTGNSIFQSSKAAVRVGSARCQSNTVFGNAGFDNIAGLSDSGTDTATVGF